MPAPLPISLHHQPEHSRLLLIVSTSLLADDDVLVNFADGTSAIYAMEELEKLRPTAKKVFPAAGDNGPLAEVA